VCREPRMFSDDIALCHAPRDRSRLEQTLRDMETQRHQMLHKKEYDKAATLRQEWHDLQERDHRETIEKECERQSNEVTRLNKANELLVHEHQQRWTDIWKDARGQWAKKLEEQQEKHELELEQLSMEIDRKESMKHDIHSSHVRDLILTETKLGEGHNYSEAKAIRMMVKDQEAREKQNFVLDRQRRKEEALGRLQAKHDSQMKQLKESIHNQQIMLEQKQNKALKNLGQRLENLQHDMRHAHLAEIQQARSANVSVPESIRRKEEKVKADRLKKGMPHGINPGKAATYRGSQMLVKMQSTPSNFGTLPLSELYDPEDFSQPSDLKQVNCLYTYKSTAS